MNRWNISSIFFLGVKGQLRAIDLKPGVNIITGASGTGKSTLIKAIDYCLGSSKCDLPAHVRRRSVAVGVKWTLGEAEVIAGRIIPSVGHSSSSRMYVSSGRSLSLPNSLQDFEGSTTLDAGKAFLETVFGIGDTPPESSVAGLTKGRATIRNATTFMFVTKEVIYSETVLLHGLEKPDKARDILAAMPYFLRAADQSSAIEELRLRQLYRALEREEARERFRAGSDTALKQRTSSLVAEAYTVGLVGALPAPDASEESLLAQLRTVSLSEGAATGEQRNETEFEHLYARRQAILDELSQARRRLQATRGVLRDASGFHNAVARQRQKLMLAEHLHLDELSEVCPICDAPSARGQETARSLKAILAKVRLENVAVERVTPRLFEHGVALEQELEQSSAALRLIDEEIRALLRQSETAKASSDSAQVRAHVAGRISFFLEASAEQLRDPPRDLRVLRDEISDLETRVDRHAKEVRLKRAEALISSYASEALAALPTVAPCVGSELQFSARQPEISVIESGTGAVLRMPDVGSDQNYLAIHIALYFGLQRHFEVARAPVPGVLVFDQISRPYFPTSGEHDETLVDGEEEDEDVQAMRRHIDFLFAETQRRNGLQVILIEHAYFADDPRYVDATRERWTRASGRGLIPADWPTRPDS